MPLLPENMSKDDANVNTGVITASGLTRKIAIVRFRLHRVFQLFAGFLIFAETIQAETVAVVRLQ